MYMNGFKESAIDWSIASATKASGASGSSSIRVHKAGGHSIRLVDYGQSYVADHWCSKGHVLYVVAGELTIEHEDGSHPMLLSVGMSWCAPDEAAPAHRVATREGATVFLVDGQ